MKNTSKRRRWKQYAAAAAGVVGTAVGLEPHDAHASILYGDPTDIAVTHGSAAYFDLDQSDSPIAGTSYATVPGWDFVLIPSGFFAPFPPDPNYAYLYHNGVVGNSSVVDGGGQGQLSYLNAGTLIGPTSLWDTYNFSYFDIFDDTNYPWFSGGTAYIGLRLGIGPSRYGWARVSYDGSDTLTLHDFAIELDPDTAILAGDTGIVVEDPSAIPEPSTLALLGPFGAAGLIEYRRRKRRQSSAAESMPAG